MKIKIMKYLLSIILMSCSISYAEIEKVQSSTDWLRLSVKAQNMHSKARKINKIQADAGLDPAKFAEDIEQINKIMKALSESGELINHKMVLLPINQLNEINGVPLILEYVEKLAEEYGYFTALEMLDMGISKQTSIFKEGEPFILNVYLPKNQFQEFQAYIMKNKLALDVQ